MTNKEIRNQAWDLLWHKNWVSKLILISSALQLSASLIMGAVTDTLKTIGVVNINETLRLLERDGFLIFFDSPLEYLTVAAMYLFFSFLMTGIVNFGICKTLNNVADNNQEGYIKSAFAAFKMPFEVFNLQFLFTLITFLFVLVCTAPFLFYAFKSSWPHMPELINVNNPLVSFVFICVAIIAVILAITIPFYRFRYIFRVKADHPEWPASKCLSYSNYLTLGNKARLIKLDLSYLKAYLVPLAIPLISLSVFSIMIFSLALTVATLYNGIGQSILYRQLLAEKESSPSLA